MSRTLFKFDPSSVSVLMIWPPGLQRRDEGTHYIANKDLMVYKMYDHQNEKKKKKHSQDDNKLCNFVKI